MRSLSCIDNEECQAFCDHGGFVIALDFNGDIRSDQKLSRIALHDVFRPDLGPHFTVHFHRLQETHFIETVIDHHGQIFRYDGAFFSQM